MSSPGDRAMFIEASQTVSGHAGVAFTLHVCDPDMVSAPTISVYGYDYDAYFDNEGGEVKIVSNALPWLAFILSIADNPALVQSIRNQYNDLIAQAKEEQGDE